MGLFFDFSRGVSGFSSSDDLLFNDDGDMLLRMSDNIALDLEDGEIHMISDSDPWDEDDW